MTSAIEDSIARVRSICTAFPKAVEKGGVASGVGALSGTGVITFTVSRRVFARMFVLNTPARGEQLVLWIRAEQHERASLLATGHPYFPAGAREVGIVLDADTDWTEIPELVTESYLIMAPKKLAAEAADALRRSTNDSS